MIEEQAAEVLWRALPTDHLEMIRWNAYERGELSFILYARRCGRLVEGKPVLSGGVEICAFIGPGHDKLFRLKPGWGEAEFKTKVKEAFSWAISQVNAGDPA